MAKPKIRTIVFDFGGVIAHGGYLDFLKHYCAECMTAVGQKKIGQLEHQVNLGQISETEFYHQIAEAFHVHLDPVKMHKLIVKNMRANQSLVHLIPKLQPAKIVLFSNAIGHMVTEVMRARHLKPKELFDRVFLSNVIHMAKPDRNAYAYVVRQMKVKPAQALLVDDRVENVTAARHLGLQAIAFKTTAQFKKELQKYELV